MFHCNLVLMVKKNHKDCQNKSYQIKLFNNIIKNNKMVTIKSGYK